MLNQVRLIEKTNDVQSNLLATCMMSQDSNENIITHHSIWDGDFRELLEQSRKKEQFTDVKLKVGDKLFAAHRNVLSIYSPVLKALITEHWPNTKIYEIDAKYVDVEIVENLLSFLYTGKIKFMVDNVNPICVAANYLQIQPLLEVSAKHLCELITVENLFSIYEFSMNCQHLCELDKYWLAVNISSKKCQIENLRKSCLRFISMNHEKVLQDPKILEYSSSFFNDMIFGLKECPGYPSLRENTFHCIIRWTEADTQNRSESVSNLLSNIPMKELPYEFFSETVCNHPLLKKISYFGDASSSQSKESARSEAVKSYQNPSNFLCTNQKLIVMSGNGLRAPVKSSMCYDPKTKVWSELPDMIHSKASFVVRTAVFNEQYILVWGPYKDEKDCYVDSVEMFDWAEKTWTELPQTPIQLRKPSMAIHDGKIYLFGAPAHIEPTMFELASSYTDPDEADRVLLCYSFETNQWTTLKTMVFAGKIFRDFLFPYKNYLYAFSGDESPLQKYDLNSDEWTVISKGIQKDCWDHYGYGLYFAAAEHMNKIYFYSPYYIVSYDPEKNAWNCIRSPAPWDTNYDIILVSMNGKLLAVGARKCAPMRRQNYYDDYYGYDTESENEDEVEEDQSIYNWIYEFDFSTEKWIEFCRVDPKLNGIYPKAVAGNFN